MRISRWCSGEGSVSLPLHQEKRGKADKRRHHVIFVAGDRQCLSRSFASFPYCARFESGL